MKWAIAGGTLALSQTGRNTAFGKQTPCLCIIARRYTKQGNDSSNNVSANQEFADLETSDCTILLLNGKHKIQANMEQGNLRRDTNRLEPSPTI